MAELKSQPKQKLLTRSIRHMWAEVTILVRETVPNKDNSAAQDTACTGLAKLGMNRTRYGSTHL